jgi:RNA polymerase sigma factor (sigma-70 family)
MPKATLGDMLRTLRSMCAADKAQDLTDRQLLQQFLAEKEAAAFTILMHRHGPMVLGIGQRVLGDAHSAEDVFQATFLLLVRRAASIPCTGSLGNWLYAVAQRIALKARAQTAARRRRERRATQMPRAEPLDELTCQELRSVLDEEIGRLPEKYRSPIVLCNFEGKSYDQAALELGCPKDSLAKRLARARELLRHQLTQRGISLGVGTLALFLAEKTARAAVSARLTMNTVKAAASVAAGKAPAAAYLSTAAAALVEHAMRTRLPEVKTKLVLLVVAMVLAAVGAGLAGGGVADNAEHRPTAKPLRLEKAPAGAITPVAFGGEPRLQVEIRPGHTNYVESVALSADGKYLVTGTTAKAAILWETSSGKKIHTVQGHSGDVLSVALSVDGKHLVTGSKDKTAILWEASTGKKLNTFLGHTRWVTSVALSADGKYLVTGSYKTAIMWEASSGKKLLLF